MLCGPPTTLMKRTVVPGAMVRVLGSNDAWLVPLPVIFTSTTGPAGAAGVVAAGVLAAGVAAAGAALAFLSPPPHAAAPSATSTARAVKRIGSSSEGFWRVLVNSFTMYPGPASNG